MVASQQGTVNTALINPGCTHFENFIVQMIYQHLVEYVVLLGFGTQLTNLLSQVRVPFTLAPLNETELLRSLSSHRRTRSAAATGVQAATLPLMVNLPRRVILQVPVGSEPEYTAQLVSALIRQLD